MKAEKEHLNFVTDNSENYNVPFTIRELCDDTATGPDEIHYQLQKHLPRDSLMVLLDIFKDIWASGKIPECWKPGQDSKNPVQLSSHISDKLFMQNHGKND